MGILEASRDTQRSLVALLQPTEVCLLYSTCTALAAVCQQTRRAILISRHKLKTQVRHIRKTLEHREQFLQQECKLQLPLLDAQTAQNRILEQLQRSPDGIRDLAAAVQGALAAVTHQTSTPPHVLKALKDDLVRLANFVCLLAWRQHLRSRRAGLQHTARQPANIAANAVPNGWEGADGDEDDHEDHVQVVLLQPEPPAGQQQQQQQELVAVVAGHGSAPVAEPRQQHQPATASAHGIAPQRQQPEAPEAVQVASVSMQTELGPSMAEVAELISGLEGLMASSASRGAKPCRATLNLLAHHIQQQLQAWNLPGADPAVAAAAVHPQANEM